MIRTTKLSLLSLSLVATLATGAAKAQENNAHAAPKPERQAWTFAGPFGTYDRAQLQRGFQVYREVCSNCHSMQSVSIRNVGEPGGPEFSEAQVKALAADYKVKDGPNDAGEMFERPGRPSDRFPSPYPNPEAARATLGAVPPDFSVLAKARSYSRGFPLFVIDALPIPGGAYQEHGVDYIYALLNGYSKNDDPNYNDYFPGHKIGMAKPLSDGQVEYTDGSPKTVQQYARDVAAFMMWAAEPKLEDRKRTGFRVMAFLLIFGGLLYYTKKKVWSAIAH
ncbi:MAG: Cytochrome c1 [Hyphomicrobiales bacterium]|nr:Cytochrome c1 [Hyphomicrobiales bacterium]